MTENELKKLTKKQLIAEILRLTSPRVIATFTYPNWDDKSPIAHPSWQWQGTCMECANGTCTKKYSHT